MTVKKKILMTFMAFAGALLFCELAARAMEVSLRKTDTGLFNGAFVDRSLIREDWQMGWLNVPQTEGLMIHSSDGSPNRVVPLAWDLSSLAGTRYQKSYFRINSLGNRGPEISREKEPGVTRVVFAGDSVTFGFYVPEEETFVARISQKLAQKAPQRRFEFVNAGVSSLGCAEIYAHIKNRIMEWKPDLIVWGFYLNDLNEDEKMHLFPSRSLGGWNRFSALARLAAQAIRERAVAERWLVEEESERKIESDWEQAEAALVAAKHLTESAHAKLAVLCLPSGYQLGKPWTKKRYQEKLKALCELHRIDFVDSMPYLESKGDPAALYFKGDWIHPNAEGNQAIADGLLAYFQDKYLNA